MTGNLEMKICKKKKKIKHIDQVITLLFSFGGEWGQEKDTQVLTSLHLTNVDILGCWML